MKMTNKRRNETVSKVLQLPEILPIIIRQLPIEDILICKSVSKRWQIIIKNYVKLNTLVIANNPTNSIAKSRLWFNTYARSNCLHLITRPANLELIDQESTRSLFQNLKKLFVISRLVSIDFINKFNNLVQLQVELSLHGQGSHKLKLDELKILSIQQSMSILDTLTLVTPKLEKVRIYGDYPKLVFQFPESVKLIECSKIQESMKSLVNLERFFCADEEQFDGDLLSKFAKLEQLHCLGNKEKMLSLFDQKKRMRRNELTIYFGGINFDDQVPDLGKYDLKLGQIGRSLVNGKLTRLYADYFTQLAPILPVIWTIDYNSLESHFGRIPMDLCLKFTNLFIVRICTKVIDEVQLADFLRVCGHFADLQISGLAVTQDFLENQLPLLCPHIHTLKIWNYANLEFLLKFNAIRNLEASIDSYLKIILLRKFPNMSICTLSHPYF